jgi:small subunit ribosomal protein S4
MVKKLKKQYETPNTGWNEERINREEELIEDYGLKNKKEIYKAQSQLRSFRRQARKLFSRDDEKGEKEVREKANSLGLIREKDGLEELLTLKVTDILDRRIQSAVERKGFADTPKDARQKVVHGHVYVNGERINTPGYLLTQEEEKELEIRMPEKDEEDASDEDEESGEQQESEDEDSEETEADTEDKTETEEEDEEPKSEQGSEDEEN